MKSAKATPTKSKARAKKKPSRNTSAKRRPIKKKAAKKKTTKRKVGRKKRGSRKKAANRATAPPMSIQSTQLAIAVRQAEEVLEQASSRLADARDRVARAAMTARLKRTESAHLVADRARDAVAAINVRRMEVTARLRAVHDAIKEQHKMDLDWHKREQALKDALERYEEILRAHDRRVARRAREGPKR